VRVKSVTTAMLGMEGMPGAMPGMAGTPDSSGSPPVAEQKKEERAPSALDILRGVLGR
jgi:hypothetical protein